MKCGNFSFRYTFTPLIFYTSNLRQLGLNMHIYYIASSNKLTHVRLSKSLLDNEKVIKGMHIKHVKHENKFNHCQFHKSSKTPEILQQDKSSTLFTPPQKFFSRFQVYLVVTEETQTTHSKHSFLPNKEHLRHIHQPSSTSYINSQGVTKIKTSSCLQL